MKILTGFEQLSFVEQIQKLENIAAKRQHETIDDLFEICETQAHNDALVYTAKNTLRTLLLENEAKTVEGLASENRVVRSICLNIAEQKKFDSAAPVLMIQAQKEQDKALLLKTLASLAQLQPAEAIDIFKIHLSDNDPLIASTCIKMMGSYKDSDSVPLLFEIITAAEDDEHYENCELTTSEAISALGEIASDEAARLLVSKIHHRNPTARRIIHESITACGDLALSHLQAIFNEEAEQNKVLAANILGNIGTPAASEVLVEALANTDPQQANTVFALYEALGRAPSLKGLVALTGGLANADKNILMAVIHALDGNISPSIIARLKKITQQNDKQSSHIIRAIIVSKATSIFEALFEGSIAERLGDQLASITQPDIVQTFSVTLAQIGNEESIKLLDRLTRKDVSLSGKLTILAIDDSQAILNITKNILASLSYNTLTALNGQEALDMLHNNPKVDIVLTDLNMPIMDGIEFTRKMRTDLHLTNIPVIMVTTETEKSQRRLARKAGVDAFLNKPFDTHDLQTILDEFI